MPKLYVQLEEEAQKSANAMASEETQTESAPASNAKPKVKERVREYRDNTELIIKLSHLSLVVVILLAVAVVFSRVGNFNWFFDTKPVGTEPITDFALALAPLLALTLAIERLVETLFSYCEGQVESMAKFSNLGTKYYKTIDAELKKATDEYLEVFEKLGTATEENRQEIIAQLNKAEAWVETMNERIGSILKDPRYVAFKQRMAIWLGFALGFVVAILTDRGIFEYLQIGMPRILDMLITGAIIGAGTGPVHSLVGALDGLKGALKNFKPAIAK